MKLMLSFLFLFCSILSLFSQNKYISRDDATIDTRYIESDKGKFATIKNKDYFISVGYEEFKYHKPHEGVFYFCYDLPTSEPRVLPENSLMLLKLEDGKTLYLETLYDTNELDCEYKYLNGKGGWYIPAKYVIEKSDLNKLFDSRVVKVRFEQPWSNLYHDLSFDDSEYWYFTGVFCDYYINVMFQSKESPSVYDDF